MKNRALYTINMEKELSALTTENETLRKYVRSDTLALMKDTLPDTVLKKVRARYIIKRISITVAVCTGAILLFSLVSSFFNGMSVSLSDDLSLSDPDFIPDSTTDLNVIGSGTGLSTICAQGDYFYYTEKGVIYKESQGNRTEVAKADAVSLNIYKYSLYYYDRTEKAIQRVRTDGKDCRVLVEDVMITDLQVYNDTVYFLNSAGEVYSIYTNGKRLYPIITDNTVYAFTVYGGYIYCVTQKDGSYVIARYKTNGSPDSLITEADIPLTAFSDGCIFYIHEGILYGFSADKEKSYAFFAGADAFACLNGKLLTLSDGNLWILDTDGSDIRLIKSGIEGFSKLTPKELIATAGGGTDEK